jgi:hypothetical protein
MQRCVGLQQVHLVCPTISTIVALQWDTTGMEWKLCQLIAEFGKGARTGQ